MPYMLVTTVEFADDDTNASRGFLSDQLIPIAKALPGFQSGTWTRAGRKGLGAVIFDTEANAQAGVATLQERRPADAPSITSNEIYEVMGQA